MPARTPINILENAVAKMVKDPEFLKASMMLTHGAPHVYGKALLKGYAKGVSGSPEVLDYMKEYLTKEYNMVFD